MTDAEDAGLSHLSDMEVNDQELPGSQEEILVPTSETKDSGQNHEETLSETASRNSVKLTDLPSESDGGRLTATADTMDTYVDGTSDICDPGGQEVAVTSELEANETPGVCDQERDKEQTPVTVKKPM